MDLNERQGTWVPESKVFDIRDDGDNKEYNELRAMAARGEIRSFQDGLDKGWTGYNQKDLEFIVVCKWWSLRVPKVQEDLEGDHA